MSDIRLKYFSVPLWYQELSDRQMLGADSLHENMQNDIILYDSIEFVCKSIVNIGLKPIPPKYIINECIYLSRGNDLAFLWFLWLLFYNNKEKANYFDLNERIIFSTICHLDMITTLKALDKILPKSMQRDGEHKSENKKIKLTEKTSNTKLFVSPYLQKLPRPKCWKSRTYQRPKIPPDNLKPYAEYLVDANYKVPNEATRWFTNSGTKPALNANSDASNALNPELKQQILTNICELFFAADKRLSTHLLNLIQMCKQSDCIDYCNMNSNSAGEQSIAVTMSQLNFINNRDEFEKFAQLYVRQTTVQKCLKALITNSDKLKNIKLCANCSICTKLNLTYIQIVARHEYLHEKCIKSLIEMNYNQIIDQYTYGTKGKPNDKVLAMQLDEVARNILKASTDQHDDHEIECIELCVKNVRRLRICLWNNFIWPKLSPSYLDIAIGSEDQTTDTKLCIALKQLQTNPKYVLAALPNSHRLPILQQWIRNRYGITYSRKYRQIALNEVCAKLKLFNEQPFKIDQLQMNDDASILNVQNSIPFDKKKVIISILNEEFHHRLAKVLIDRQRELWTILRPYLCTSGLPRRLYFAYMPACEYDAR